MPFAAASSLRVQIEGALASRIPSALTPATKPVRAVVPTGIGSVDAVLEGGLPVGAVTELVGAECSGRTALALSFAAKITQSERVCAWVDVSDCFSPESGAAAGIDLTRLLWVRCGAAASAKAVRLPKENFSLPEKYLERPAKPRGLHGGGFGPHPRSEVKGLSDGVRELLRSAANAPKAAEKHPRMGKEQPASEPVSLLDSAHGGGKAFSKPWARIEQALRVTDLLLQAGGFSAIVLDMGSLAPQHVSRIPLATWFRYRAAAERTQGSVLLLTQYACARSSAGAVLHLRSEWPKCEESGVLVELEHHVELARQRFVEAPAKVVSIRKPPQRANHAEWHSRAAWAGRQ
jgi:hypothetical protein